MDETQEFKSKPVWNAMMAILEMMIEDGAICDDEREDDSNG